MSRSILMLVPALAFALPFVMAQPTMARPLATPAPETLWGGHDDDDDDDGGDSIIELQVCFDVQIAIENDDRAYSCQIVEGDACYSRCTAEAVAPLCVTELGVRSAGLSACQQEAVDTCRSQCDSGGAGFCSPESEMQLRHKDDDDDDDDDDDGGDDEVVFINIEHCVDLVLDLDNL